MLGEDKKELSNDMGAGKILIVDDETLILFTMRVKFQNAGFNVTIASSPNEAMKEFAKESFDVVLSDINMSPINGFAFRRLIREQNKELPIIFLTGVQNDMGNNLLSKIMEDLHSYYVPKASADTYLAFKVQQVIQNYTSMKKVKELETRMKRNLELASIVQFSMLPPWVRFEKNYEFSCFYKPFGTVSGDLFDWIQIDEYRCLGIFGDVSGHDTAAALGMTAVQSFVGQIIAAYGKNNVCKPHQIAQELDDFIISHIAPAVYMCGIVIYFDFENNTICYHNAGHKDIIGYDTAKNEFLDINPENKGSMAMGMSKGIKHLEEENVTYHFTDDTLFLIASDGLGDLSRDEAGKDYLDANPKEFNQLIEILAHQGVEEDNTISMPYRCYESLEWMGYTHPQDDCLMFMLRKPRLVDRERIFVCRLSPNNVAVDNVGMKASDFVLEQCGDDILSEKVELLVEEHMNNIVEHGLNECRRDNEYIVLKIAVIENGLKVTIWDRGKHWSENTATPTSNPDMLLEQVNEQQSGSGRGLLIISKIASEISRHHYSGLNETVFIVKNDTEGLEIEGF